MTDRLQAGQQLNINDQLVSPNGRYILLMQPDGNLVLYHDSIAVSTAYWSTDTWRLPAIWRPSYALMQSDGHFVLYDASRTPRWASGTWGPDFIAPYIVLQDDGNLVIYHNGLQPVWASGGVGGNGAIPARGYVTLNQSMIEVTEEDVVGFAKKMRTKATLYRNGLLLVETFSESRAAFSGLRGCVIVICIDDAGRAQYVSDTIVCKTRCSVTDPTCPSSGTDAWTQQLPEPVGRLSTTLNIVHFEGQDPVSFTQRIIKGIQETTDLAGEIKPLVDLLVPIIREL
jgi:hypothetical protein